MNRRFLKRLLVSPMTVLWTPTVSMAFPAGVGASSHRRFLGSLARGLGKDGTTDGDDADSDWNGDSYWLRQIHRRGEGRPDYQWFRHRSGLPFACTGCGKCCKTQGRVYMTPEEVADAAELLDLSRDEFVQRYASHTLVDEHDGEIWVRLLDHSTSSSSRDHGCVFLQEDNTCGIYQARPIQCSTYPFWPNILASQQDWNDEVRRSDDDEQSELPAWTVEGGGCEGMKLVTSNEEEEEDAQVGVVLREQVYEQAYWYEHDDRRFPRGKEIPVHKSSS